MRRAGDDTNTDAILNYRVNIVQDKLDKIILALTLLILLYIVLVGIVILV